MTCPNPYPGLRPFYLEDADFFFGRESAIDDLLTRLARTRFLAVIGSSGCGKSGLIRAGLVPALQSGLLASAGSRWRVATLRPGRNPMGSLSRAMEDALESEGRLQETLDRTSLGLIDAVRQARLNSSENVLVIVDQFEELFRGQSRESRDEPIAFVRMLLEAASQRESPIYLVIALRSDFLGECAAFRGLAEALNDGLYLVPEMTRDQLRSAIEEPAQLNRVSWSPLLVHRILNDIYEHPDYLPVFQHALRRTWDAWVKAGAEGPIGLQNYESAGGPESLDRHAEEIYASLDPPQKDHPRKVFQCLTETGLDRRVSRRPARMAELTAMTGAPIEQVREVVARFRGAMLLTPGDLSPESVCDLPHESLMRLWRRLAHWIVEEAEDASIFRRLSETAILHSEARASLLHGPELQAAREWIALRQPPEAWALRYGGDLRQAIQFVEASDKPGWRLFRRT